MSLWLLRPVPNRIKGNDPWDPWYNKAFGFVVRAETEEQARRLAETDAGCESRHPVAAHEHTRFEPWRDPFFSTCTPLTTDGPEVVVICDFASA